MKKQLWFLVFVVAGSLALAAGQASAGGGPTYEQQPGPTSPAPSSQASSSPSPGTTATSQDAPLASPTPAYRPTAGIAAGKAFKTANSPTVYLLIDGQLHPLTSEAALLAWGYNRGQIRNLSPSQLAAYPAGSQLGIPDGTIVKAGNGPAYIIFGNHKNPASPPKLLDTLGLSLARTITISEGDLANIPDGPPVIPLIK